MAPWISFFWRNVMTRQWRRQRHCRCQHEGWKRIYSSLLVSCEVIHNGSCTLTSLISLCKSGNGFLFLSSFPRQLWAALWWEGGAACHLLSRPWDHQTHTTLVRLKTAQGLHTDSALANIYKKQHLGLLYDASEAYNHTTEVSVRGTSGYFCWIDISTSPSFPGLSFIPGGASCELEGPTAFRCSLRCSSSGLPTATAVLWWLQGGLLASLRFLLLLLPEVAVVGTCQVCGYSPFLLFVHQHDVQRVHLFVSLHQGVQQDLSMVILSHLWRHVPLWPQSVQSSKTGPAIAVNISATWPLYLQASDTCMC